MKELRFPLLTKNQIEVRVGQVSAKGCTLLLYKTSRTDAEILDQVVGVGNWQKKFYTLQGVGVGDSVRSIVVCSVGIYDDDKHEWIWKDDSGTESQVEQDKGVCSDAFKRASGGSCWGIGRELYYTGFIFVKVPTQQKYDNAGKPKGYELVDKYMSFEVQEISWYENPLSLKTLVIVDNNGNVVFSKKNSTNISNTTEKPSLMTNEPITKADVDFITNYIGTLGGDKYNNFFAWLEKKFGTRDFRSLNAEQGKIIVNALKGNK